MASFDQIADRALNLAEIYARQRQPQAPRVVTGGRNLDNTAGSAYNQAMGAATNQMANYRQAAQGMEDLRRRNAAGGMNLPGLMSQGVGQASRPAGQAGMPAPQQQLAALTGGRPLTQNPNYQPGQSDFLTSQRQYGRDWMLPELYDRGRQNMQPGQAMVVTEGNRVFTGQPNYQYDIQNQITDPNLRAAVPSMAESYNAGIAQQQQQRQAEVFGQLSERFTPESVRDYLASNGQSPLQPKPDAGRFEVKQVKEYDDMGNVVAERPVVVDMWNQQQTAGGAGSAAAGGGDAALRQRFNVGDPDEDLQKMAADWYGMGSARG